ncbi:MAG: hypothetical protein AAFR79_20835 [Pseudomonadota bacterium]
MRGSDDIKERLVRWSLPSVAVFLTMVAVIGIVSILSSPTRSPSDGALFVSHVTSVDNAAARSATLAEEVEHLASRPLFHASRRAWQPAETPNAQPARIPTPAVLGIVGYGDEFLALIAPGGGGPARRVGLGYQVGVWTVASIEPDRVELVRADGQTIMLKLKREE